MSHAYLFTGGAGAGKRMFANTFAKALQCEGAGEDVFMLLTDKYADKIYGTSFMCGQRKKASALTRYANRYWKR